MPPAQRQIPPHMPADVDGTFDSRYPTDAEVATLIDAAVDGALGVAFVFTGNGEVLRDGATISNVVVPFAATITGWTIASTEAGSMTCTVARTTWDQHPNYTTISGTEPPRLASEQKRRDTSLGTWATALSAGAMLRVTVDSADTVTNATVTIEMERS